MQIQPRAKALALLITIALLFLYQTLHVLAASVGSSGAGNAVTLFVFLLPNLVLGGLGIWLLVREARR